MASMLETLGMTAFGAAIVGGILIFGLKRYFGTYLDRKAANLADKEDIAQITKKVESVKQANAEALAHLQEQLKATTTLRFLAAEKRFEAHQKAYRFAINMKQMAFEKDEEERVKAFEEWGDFWQRECLYLDRDVRKAFADAAMASQEHMMWMNMGREMKNGAEDVSANMIKMDRLVAVILEAVQLPPIVREFETATGKLANS